MARTLEQKIADAGPFNQRVDPHILTVARKDLEAQHVIRSLPLGGIDWYYLAATDISSVTARLADQSVVHEATMNREFTQRLGQAAEIAVYRSLLEQHEFQFLGSYTDLPDHDDSTLYSKEEPPSGVSGLRIPGKKKLDFLLFHKSAGAIGVEVKNVREWFYPDREGIREMLVKCTALNAVPVLIARRIPYATFSVLNRCGVIVHQLYGQIYPEADAALAAKARDKNLLGYHDIRVGNKPDERLTKFISVNLPEVVQPAREKFDLWRTEIEEYAAGQVPYSKFVAKLKGL